MVNGQGVAWNERKARAYGRGASALAPGVVKGLTLCNKNNEQGYTLYEQV